MSITIRTALEEDFIAMYKMDLAANATHPFYVIPWKTAGPGACKAFILDRYQYLYHSRNPKYTFIVATAGDEIVGYLIYQKNPGEDEPEEWNPNLPDGTNLRFFEKVIPEVKAAKKHCNLKDCWGPYLIRTFCALKEVHYGKYINSDYRTGGFCSSSELAAQRDWIDVGQEVSRGCRCRSCEVLRAFVKDWEILV